MLKEFVIKKLPVYTTTSSEFLEKWKEKVNTILASREFGEFKELSMQKLSTESLQSFAQLVWLNIKVGVGNLIEYSKILFKYYGNSQFLKSDFSFTLMYLFHNPYSMSKRFLTTRGDENTDIYGETPLTTLEQILRQANITKKDHLFELGCGRGRSCFWANAFMGCKVTGIDMIPDFIDRARMIKNRLHLEGITFRNEELTQSDLSGGTVYYLYGSALDDEVINSLVKKFEQMPVGTKFITVSFPLSDYTDSPHFEMMKCFQARYPWGVADVYLTIRK